MTISNEVTVASHVGGDGVQVWVGTRDDWLGSMDEPTKMVGTCNGGAFTAATTGNCVNFSSATEYVLYSSTDADAKGLIADCCSFSKIVALDPTTTFSTAGVTEDSLYRLYLPFGTMTAGQTKAMSVEFEAQVVGATNAPTANAPTTNAPTPTVTAHSGASDMDQLMMLLGFFGFIMGYLLMVFITILIVDAVAPNLVQ